VHIEGKYPRGHQFPWNRLITPVTLCSPEFRHQLFHLSIPETDNVIMHLEVVVEIFSAALAEIDGDERAILN